MTNYLSFKLSDDFIDAYKDRKVDWGLVDAGGTSLSELVFLTKYSRKKENGSKETWQDVCRRVVEGTYSIQKDWVKQHRIPWNDHQAARSAQEMFDRMFSFKWTPPGRGVQNMGTYMINGLGYSTALQNCGAVALGKLKKNDPGEPFSWLAIASMMGVGVGYSTIGVDKLDITVRQPTKSDDLYVIPDTREGWGESIRLLINSYLTTNGRELRFDYDEIRPEGALISTFGTTAPGPGPLIKLHKKMQQILDARIADKVDSSLLFDIANRIGKCVVSGNTRRSALLAYGDLKDDEFIALKDWTLGHERTQRDGWANNSNNSVRAFVDSDLSKIIPGIQLNGEPGIIWEDVVKNRGRLIDPPDDKDAGFVCFNPCAEQPLEDREFCTLSSVFVSKHDSLEDFQRTLKFAFLYAKTVTLLPTHFEKSNAVMQRNRRIGLSCGGVTDFIDSRPNGHQTIRQWWDEGYKTVRRYDKIYSEWLCVRESNRVTTEKPDGTIGLKVAASPGIHFTDGGEYYDRGLRVGNKEPYLQMLKDSGHRWEADIMNPDSSTVVYFPIKSNAKRSAKHVSLFEKAALAVDAQRLWSDNSVSVTLTFDAEKEKDDVATVLNMYAGQLKTVSFLPIGNEVYPQQPYTEITEEEYDAAALDLLPAPLWDLYTNWDGDDVEDASYCTTDFCELKDETGEN